VERYVKNLTDQPILITGLGITLAASSTEQIYGQGLGTTLDDLRNCDSLMDLLDAEDIAITDGVNEFTGQKAKDSLSPMPLHATTQDITEPVDFPVPIKIPVVETAPTENLSSGQLCMDNNGIVYTYDPIRTKWVSIDRTRPVFSEDGLNVTGEWLRLGYAKHGKVGFKVKRPSTIVGVSAELADLQNRTATKGFIIRKLSGDVNTDLFNFSTVDYTYMATNLNYDLDVGEIAQVWCVNQGAHCAFPTVILELSWRLV